MDQKQPNQSFRVASFFTGIGGFDYGLEEVGMDVVFQCERNDFCRKVLRKHWPIITSAVLPIVLIFTHRNKT